MAVDGSIEITTKLDTAGFTAGQKEIEKGLAKIETEAKSVIGTINKLFVTDTIKEYGKMFASVGKAARKEFDPVKTLLLTVNDALDMGVLFASEWTKPLDKIREGGKMAFSELSAGLSKANKSMNDVQKGMVALDGLSSVFSGAESAAAGFFSGAKNIGETLAGLVPTCAAAAAAIAMVFPQNAVLAAVTAGVTGLIGLFTGFSKAQEELKQQQISDYFSGTAVTISDLTGVLAPMTEQFGTINQILSDHNANMSGILENYSQAATSMDMMFTQLSSGSETVPESAEIIYSSLMAMGDSLKQAADEDATYYFSTWKEMLSNTGTAINEQEAAMLENIVQHGEDKKAWIAAQQEEITAIHTAAKERNVGQTVAYTEEEIAKLQGFSGKLDEMMAIEQNKAADKAKYESAQLYDDIKSGRLQVNNETYEELLSSIQSNEDEVIRIAKESRATQLSEADAYMAEARLMYAEDSEEMAKAEAAYAEMRTAATANYEASLNEASNSSNAAREILKAQLNDQSEAYAMAKAQIDEFNETNAKLRTGTYENGEEAAKLRERYDELSASLANNELVSGNVHKGWEIANVGVMEEVNKMMQGISDAQDQSVSKFASYGANSTQGLIDGYKSKYGDVIAASISMAQDLDNSFKETLDIHSPSKVMAENGEYLGQGIIDGINSKRDAVLGAFSSLFNAILGKADTFCENFRLGINNLLYNMKASMNGVYVGYDGRITYSSMPPVKIPRLAKGTVIPPNNPFFAILGDQTQGRNLEAPEDLIRQIVREETGNTTPPTIYINAADDTAGGLIRELTFKIQDEMNRQGTKLINI